MTTAAETMSAEILTLEKLIAALEGGSIKAEDRPALLHNCKAMLVRKQKALSVAESGRK